MRRFIAQHSCWMEIPLIQPLLIHVVENILLHEQCAENRCHQRPNRFGMLIHTSGIERITLVKISPALMFKFKYLDSCHEQEYTAQRT